ncbi:zinc ribbon domain-containing protein [Halorubrum halodurans]|uniref:Zinc ribbon domain-containing protein n=1 Tax=Halorubrum halodurans TaxID=1383851 RepID=A0A256IR88_9EURY|nr:zinc ribbon domain-containing protein [Halorubrum halodurans]OYR58662.1 zinc ribbon domain-containing protein [Halorubrum halodurans]
MKPCPRCEASIDDSARFCSQCGAPQNEEAAEELDQYVQRQAKQVAGGAGSGGGGNGGRDGVTAADVFGVAAEELTEREQLWRRGSYVLGYATVVVALTQITNPGAWFLLLGGIAILPPTRRLLGLPVGGTFKREAMAGLYAVFVVLGVVLFFAL